MPIRLGLLIAALLLGTLLIWLILHAMHDANEPNRLLFWAILTLLWGLWAWLAIELYHRGQ